jgi:HK97 family phage portal protein
MLLNNLLSTRATSVTLGHPRDPALAELLGAPEVTAGVAVDEFTALTFAPVWAAVHVISEPVGFLPFPVFQRLSPRGKKRVPDHPVYQLLQERTNPDMSPQDFRETLTTHVLIWGNGYARIERDSRGEPIALWPRRPNQMTIERRADRSLLYTYQFTGGGKELSTAADMIHVHGLGFDGIVGYSVIGMARESLGLGMATERFGSSFFGSGARQSGIFQYPGEVTDEMMNNLERSIIEKRTGERSFNKPWVIEEGATWTPTSIPPDDAQFLQTRKFQVDEVARWFHVQPHLIASMDRAIRANIESEGIDFVRYTLHRWMKAWEHEVNFKLLGGGGDREFFAEFVIDGLLRGDSAARNASHIAGRQWGWKSANDVLEDENENPIGPQGDQYIVPLNMIPAGESSTPRLDSSPGSDERTAVSRETRTEKLETRVSARQGRAVQQRLGIARGHRVLFVDAARRVIGKEIKAVRQAAKRFLKDPANPTAFLEWLTEFYDGHRSTVRDAMAGPVSTLGDSIYRAVVDEVGGEAELPESVRSFMATYTSSAAVRETESGLGQMRAIVGEAPPDDPEGLRTAVDTRLEEWDDTRAEKFGIREVAQAASAIAVASFASAGIEKHMWVTTGSENCPICEELDGRIVGVSQAFVAKGDRLGSQEQKFQAGHSFAHPPIHDGCDCQIVSA